MTQTRDIHQHRVKLQEQAEEIDRWLTALSYNVRPSVKEATDKLTAQYIEALRRLA